jgi:hypothetical protein
VAVHFTNVTDSQDGVHLTSGVITAIPCTFFCWFNLATSAWTGGGTLVTVGQPPGGFLDQFTLLVKGVIPGPGHFVQALSAKNIATTNFAQGTIDVSTTGIWHTAAARFVTDGAGGITMSVFTDGGDRQDAAGIVTNPARMTQTQCANGDSPGTFPNYVSGFPGCMALATIFASGLSDGDIATLATGAPPQSVATPSMLLPFTDVSHVTQNLYGSAFTLSTGAGGVSTCVSNPPFYGSGNRSCGGIMGPVRVYT